MSAKTSPRSCPTCKGPMVQFEDPRYREAHVCLACRRAQVTLFRPLEFIELKIDVGAPAPAPEGDG